MPVGPRFAQGAFAIQLLLQPAQRFLHGLTLFQFNFRQLDSHPSLAHSILGPAMIRISARRVKAYRTRSDCNNSANGARSCRSTSVIWLILVSSKCGSDPATSLSRIG